MVPGSAAENLGAPARPLDLGLRGVRERVRFDHERVVDIAAREHLYGPALAREPVRVERFGRDLPLGVVLAEHLDVHHGVFDPVWVGEPFQLRHPALQRHLTALEPGRDVLASAGSLRAASGGLAAGPGPSAPDALSLFRRALCGTQMMELHHASTSSTSTRCRTFAIMPRISGRSSFTTESLIRCSPSRRTVSF